MELQNLPFKEKRLLKSLEEQGQVFVINKNDAVLKQGEYIKVIPIVLSGAISIYRRDDLGNQVFLYTIEPSETCAMTLQSYQINEPSKIFAKAITETKLLAISVENSTKWMDEFPEWKQYVFQSYNTRFQELIRTIDTIAFQKLDTRLLSYLKNYSVSTQTTTLDLTHQKIAIDLNTSREVISRLLKKLEQNGIVLLSRNKIELK